MRPSGLWLPERRLLRLQWRTATPEEISRYGIRGLPRHRLLLPPIAGGAGPALVGTAGALSVSSSAVVNPAWGAGQSRTVGNLLVAWLLGITDNTLPPTPSGWSVGAQGAVSTAMSSTILYKVAAGGDAAPTLGDASHSWGASLAEFSGCASTSPRDQPGTGTGATVLSASATASAVDGSAGELVIYLAAVHRNNNLVTSSLNNGATRVDTVSSAMGGAATAAWGYGVTTSNAVADSVTGSAASTGAWALGIASFLLPPSSIPQQLRGRHPRSRGRGPSRGRF